jgi:hypothetical protein
MKNNCIKNPFFIFVLILVIIIIVIIIYHNNILSNRSNLLEKFVIVTNEQTNTTSSIQTTTTTPPLLITNPIESSNNVPILKHIFLNNLVGDQFIKDNPSIVMGGPIIIKKKDKTIYILMNIFSLILLVPINDCTGKEIKRFIDLDWNKDDSIYFPITKEFQFKITNDNTIVSLNTLNIKEGDIKPGNIIMTVSIKDKNYSNLEFYIFCIKYVNIDTNNITITLTSIIPANFTNYLSSANIVDNIPFTVFDYIL